MSAQNHITINIHPDPGDAPTFRKPEFEPVSIDHVNIVRKGTEEGRSTVDIVLTHDETKQKYMMMLTGGVIKMLAAAIGDEP